MVARLRCIQLVHQSRLDAEGVDRVDVEAMFSSTFKNWADALSTDEALNLKIFQSGATKTPTRGRREFGPCSCCGHHFPSLRHFWQGCPKFHEERREISRQYAIPLSW